MESQPQDGEAQGGSGALKTEYLDVIISDVRVTPSLTFSVQVLNTEGMPIDNYLLCVPHAEF